jgi:membrane-bound lytic murein transglycosylase B
LQTDLDEQTQLRNLQQVQKLSLEGQEKSKKKLLTDTQGQEQKFQKMMQQAQTNIAAIKNQLYSLENVGVSMTFERALQHAQAAFNKTGVRPAFLLAILKNESSWGTKVGTGTWRKDMHTRDQGPFLKITQELGLNPDTTPVSKKPWYGWGGAMGPAQILPSVWMLLKDEVSRLTGHVPPNPWQIDDAFMGAAVKLARAGAAAGTRDAEWKAAMIYFAGGNWSNPKYRFYGDNVMDMAGTLQGQIDLIK